MKEIEIIADQFRLLTDAELDAEETRIERGRQCAQRKQDLARYNRRLTLLTAERMRRAPAPPGHFALPERLFRNT